MTTKAKQSLKMVCACGCGRDFERLPKKRYFSNACRARDWNRKHIRKIKNERPRSERKNLGVEVQMTIRRLEQADHLQTLFGFASRSEAICAAIDYTHDQFTERGR